MATMLAKITVRAGAEARWEALISDLVDKTLTHESEVIRYEYWKGSEPNTWYGLLSFASKEAFFAHQDADYHRNQPYADCIEAMHLEFVDPVQGASPLPRTENPPLPADAPATIREWEHQSPVQIAAWWANRQ